MRLFSLPYLLVPSLVAGAKHGTIGYGINMFHPWCCTACSDVLASVYLNCTTFSVPSGHDGMSMKVRKRMDMDMEMTGTTTNECYASNEPYQQSLAYCIKSHCDEEGVSPEKQSQCFERLAAGGLLVPSLENSLPDSAPTTELSDDAVWLNETMLVNEDYWNTDRRTIEAFEKSEEDHVKFSIVIIAVCVSIPVLTGLWAFFRQRLSHNSHTSRLAILVKSHFVIPALFGTRHSQPLPYNIGYAPKRALTAFISIYVVMNIVLSAVPFYSVQPNVWFANQNGEIAAYVANRTGVLSFANMALAILFSARNNPLLSLSGWTYTSFLTFHRWASRVAILQAVVHSIVYTADFCYFRDGNAYYAEAAKAYFWWGIIATTAMGLMAGLSALPLRLYAYEIFLVIHIALAILSLLGSWYHVDLRFNKKWGYEVWLYIAFAFWAYDRLTRLLKVLWYSVSGRGSTAVVSRVPGTNVVSLRIYPARSWICNPGGHTYLYFPSTGKFWENHPFTIADWHVKSTKSEVMTSPNEADQYSQSSGSVPVDIQEMNKGAARVSETEKSSYSDTERNRFYIQCYYRVHRGTTAKLHRKIAIEGVSKVSVLTEGMYGAHAVSHQALKQADKILCIAGGIGITWAAGFVKQFYNEQLSTRHNHSKGLMMPRTRRFTLAWSVREQGLLEHIQHNLLPDLTGVGLDDGCLTYQFWLTGSESSAEERQQHETQNQDQIDEVKQEQDLVSTTFGRRMDVDALLHSFMEPGRRHIVLVCGPGTLADAVRRSTATCSLKGFSVDLVEEPFSW